MFLNNWVMLSACEDAPGELHHNFQKAEGIENSYHGKQMSCFLSFKEQVRRWTENLDYYNVLPHSVLANFQRIFCPEQGPPMYFWRWDTCIPKENLNQIQFISNSLRVLRINFFLKRLKSEKLLLLLLLLMIDSIAVRPLMKDLGIFLTYITAKRSLHLQLWDGLDLMQIRTEKWRSEVISFSPGATKCLRHRNALLLLSNYSEMKSNSFIHSELNWTI